MYLLNICAQFKITLERGAIFELFILSIVVGSIAGLMGFWLYLKGKERKIKSNKLNKVSNYLTIIGFIINILLFSEVVNYSFNNVDRVIEIIAVIYAIPLLLLLIYSKNSKIKKYFI